MVLGWQKQEETSTTGATMSINKIRTIGSFFQQFLHERRNATSQPLTNMFGIPVEFPDQWCRLSWLPFTCAAEESIAKQSSWERAWHGTKLEALYAIAYHGIILESSDETQGERFFDQWQGVYLHGDANRHKIGCYSRFVQLIPNGLYFAIHWEVRTDRKIPC